MKTPAFWYDPTQKPSFYVRALEPIYATLRRVHVALTRPAHSPVPTICIGNAVAGGSGKTPVALALHQLLDLPDCLILARGYGGALSGPVRITPGHTAHDVGDEAVLMARHAPVIIARNRLEGASFAQTSGVRMALMDDGLQTWTLTAQTNLLVVDGATGFGNGHLLPAGPLREPLADLFPRLHAVILVGRDATGVRKILPHSLPVFTATFTIDTSAIAPAQPVAAFAGLARPQKFFDSLAAAGLQVSATQSFPDHHPYTSAEIRSLIEWADALHAQLVTTEKDVVKIAPEFLSRVKTIPLIAQFDQPADLKTFILSRLS